MKKFLLPLVAVFLLLGGVVSIVHSFDLNDLTWMKENGLTKFSTMEEFGPERKITRGEASKFVVSYADAIGHAKSSSGCTFDDISGFDVTLEPFIIDACDYGLITGHDGSYFPRSFLTEAQALAIAMRTIQGRQDETVTPRYSGYYLEAKEYGLLSSETMLSIGETDITREKFGKWLVTLGRLHQSGYFEIKTPENPSVVPGESEQPVIQPQAVAPQASQSNLFYDPVTNTYAFKGANQSPSMNGTTSSQNTTNTTGTPIVQNNYPTTLGLEVMTVDERFGIGLEDKPGIDFYSMRVRPIVTGAQPQNLIIQTTVSENHCIDFPKLNLPEGFTYISRDGGTSWKLLSTIARKTSTVSRNPMLCGELMIKVVYPQDWELFSRGLGFSLLEIQSDAGTCQQFLVSADNAGYVEEEVCYK